jgi:sortase A
MNKVKLSRIKFSPFAIVSLGCVILGVGCVCLAIIKIELLSAKLTYTNSSNTPYITAVAFKQDVLAEDGLTGEYDPSGTPDADINLYPVYPSEGDKIGTLSIPVIELDLPVVQGTDGDDLEKGVGHFVQSVLPGEDDNCVLSGHRDTVFSRLGELKIGDQLFVQTSAGTFTYEVSGMRIVDKDDKTVIVPTDHATLTLTTCYPFIFIGHAPDRYIVSADLVTC